MPPKKTEPKRKPTSSTLFVTEALYPVCGYEIQSKNSYICLSKAWNNMLILWGLQKYNISQHCILLHDTADKQQLFKLAKKHAATETEALIKTVETKFPRKFSIVPVKLGGEVSDYRFFKDNPGTYLVLCVSRRSTAKEGHFIIVDTLVKPKAIIDSAETKGGTKTTAPIKFTSANWKYLVNEEFEPWVFKIIFSKSVVNEIVCPFSNCPKKCPNKQWCVSLENTCYRNYAISETMGIHPIYKRPRRLPSG